MLHLVILDRREFLAKLVREVQMEKGVIREIPGQKVMLVLQALRVTRVTLAKPGPLALRVTRGSQELKVIREKRVRQDQQGLPDLKVTKVKPVPRDQPATIPLAQVSI
jgi:hypothetical protein